MQITEPEPSTIPEHLMSEANQAASKLSSTASRAMETLYAKGERLKAAQAKLMCDCRSQIKDNPIAALGIAAGVTAGVGFLLHYLRAHR